MKKIKISYVPYKVYILPVLIWVTIAGVGAAFYGEPGVYVTGLIGIIAFLYFCTRRTVVEYGDGNIIRCRCSYYKWKIDLEKIDTFVYTISEHITRGGPRYSMDIRFNHDQKGVEDYYKLSTILLGKELDKMIRNSSDKLDLMQLYKYAESLYPEKAKGYTKEAGIND